MWNKVYSISVSRKILLIFPKFPPTFWNLHFAFRDLIRGPKCAIAPLPALTVASFFPKCWTVRFVDENVYPVKDDDIRWADIVVASCTMDQIDSFEQIVRRAHAMGKPVVVGGLGPSLRPHFYEGADYVHIGMIGDATTELMIELSNNSKRPEKQKIFNVNRRLSLKDYPLPRYELIRLSDYAAMCVQIGTGCPFSCEFCEIITFYGRVPDIKKPEQILKELNVLYAKGWRGSIHFADDNFIGDLPRRKDIILSITEWQREHGYPFSFTIEVSIDLAGHPDLLKVLQDARIFLAIIGVETPKIDTLKAIAKYQNVRAPLFESVATLHKQGIQVSGTFVLGFDSDGPDAGEAIINFVEKTAICVPQLTVLLALQGTPLYDRLKGEGRLITRSYKWDILDSNVLFKRGQEDIFRQYVDAWDRIFKPKALFNRIQRNFILTHGGNARYDKMLPLLSRIVTFFNMIWRMGIRADYRWEFWKFFVWALFHKAFYYFVYWTILAYHYIGFRKEILQNPPKPTVKSDEIIHKDYARVKNGPIIYKNIN